MKKIAAPSLVLRIEQEKPGLVLFKSDTCHLCIALDPLIREVANKNKHRLDFYFIDTNEDTNSDIFDEYVDGTPSILMFEAGSFSVLKDPDVPDDETWYTSDYLNKAIEQFLGE
jgi:thiol-disulfide isomerase/thioredoxin